MIIPWEINTRVPIAYVDNVYIANTILSDANLYPYFFRTIPTTIMHLDAIMDVVRAADWNRISLIYDIETIGWAGKKKRLGEQGCRCLNLSVDSTLLLCLFFFHIGREYFAAKAQKMGIYILAFQPLTTPGIPLDESFEFVKSRIHATQSRIQVLIATGSIQETFLTEMKYSLPNWLGCLFFMFADLETNIVSNFFFN